MVHPLAAEVVAEMFPIIRTDGNASPGSGRDLPDTVVPQALGGGALFAIDVAFDPDTAVEGIGQPREFAVGALAPDMPKHPRLSSAAAGVVAILMPVAFGGASFADGHSTGGRVAEEPSDLSRQLPDRCAETDDRSPDAPPVRLSRRPRQEEGGACLAGDAIPLAVADAGRDLAPVSAARCGNSAETASVDGMKARQAPEAGLVKRADAPEWSGAALTTPWGTDASRFGERDTARTPGHCREMSATGASSLGIREPIPAQSTPVQGTSADDRGRTSEPRSSDSASVEYPPSPEFALSNGRRTVSDGAIAISGHPGVLPEVEDRTAGDTLSGPLPPGIGATVSEVPNRGNQGSGPLGTVPEDLMSSPLRSAARAVADGWRSRAADRSVPDQEHPKRPFATATVAEGRGDTPLPASKDAPSFPSSVTDGSRQANKPSPGLDLSLRFVPAGQAEVSAGESAPQGRTRLVDTAAVRSVIEAALGPQSAATQDLPDAAIDDHGETAVAEPDPGGSLPDFMPPAERAVQTANIERASGAALGPGAAEAARGVAAQLAEAIAKTSDRSVEVALAPEELGRVRLTLHATESGLTMGIVAERPETLDLMRRHIDQLSRDFRDLGFANLTFNFGQGQDGSNRRPQSPTELAAVETDAVFRPVAPTKNVPAGALDAPASGLDLRI